MLVTINTFNSHIKHADCMLVSCIHTKIDVEIYYVDQMAKHVISCKSTCTFGCVFIVGCL